MKELSVVSYNIHKGFSPFGRQYTLASIKERLESLNADIVFLQEVRGLCSKGEHANQLEHLADTLWPHTAYGRNAIYTSAHHGNAILSRYPMIEMENRDVSRNRFEKRGILYSGLKLEGMDIPIHLFCIHLNLLERDRFFQARELLEFIYEKANPLHPVIVAGDFNDWTGRLTRYLSGHLIGEPADSEKKIKTYPSFLPMLQLDRILVKNMHMMTLKNMSSQEWQGLSDHLPLVARVALGR